MIYFVFWRVTYVVCWSFLRSRSQPPLDEGDHVLVGHRVPDPVRGQHDEVPVGVELEGLDLGHGADHLLPGRLVDLGFQEEIPETPGGNQDAPNPVRTANKRIYESVKKINPSIGIRLVD